MMVEYYGFNTFKSGFDGNLFLCFRDFRFYKDFMLDKIYDIIHISRSRRNITIFPIMNMGRIGFIIHTSVKARKITGSNIVVFCMLKIILNALLLTMQNVFNLLF